MGIIRGKIEADREIVAKYSVVGETTMSQCSCGCKRWFDTETGKEYKATPFTEMFEHTDAGVLCNKPPKEETNG